MPKRYISAISIGSSRIKGAVGCIDTATGSLTVLAIDEQPISGSVRYGWVNNVEEVSNHIAGIVARLQAVQAVAPRKIESVYVGISGRSLASNPHKVSLRLQGEQKITADTMAMLQRDAYESFHTDYDIVGIMPGDFTVDNIPTVNPVGSYGNTVAGTYNIFTCRPQLLRNIHRVFDDRLSLDIAGTVILPVAESELVLTSDERRLGCMLVDLGSETTTVSIYKDGELRYLATIPIGGRNITRDIASLGVTEERAEDFKVVYGDAMPDESATVPPSAVGDILSDIVVGHYIQARAGESAANIMAHVDYAGMRLSDLTAGIILVGGGARLRNFGHLIENESKLHVRIGVPSSNVRIADSSIQPVREVDIISLLNSSVVMGSDVECVIEPKPVNVQSSRSDAYEGTPGRQGYVIDDTDDDSDMTLFDDDPDPDDLPEFETPERQVKKKSIPEPQKPSRWISIRDRIIHVMKGPDEEDDE